ncbi:MAG: ABC transporter ATP-binding protein, partial [Acetatifactor sp.]|nr:ABC transporter ATP-binding protein [Acetatifactor sp.]
IHNPALLVLDEPNSGLDPRARVEMKELLQNLRSMGKTIVISSHILSELSEMCNSIGIMNHGNLVAAGRIEDVMAGVFGNNQLVITLDEGRETALRVVNEHAKVKVDSVGEHEIKLSHNMTKPEIAGMVGAMIAAGVVVTGFHKQEGDLETLFMRVTGDGQ